jgi:hypothetical protein
MTWIGFDFATIEQPRVLGGSVNNQTTTIEADTAPLLDALFTLAIFFTPGDPLFNFSTASSTS